MRHFIIYDLAMQVVEGFSTDSDPSTHILRVPSWRIAEIGVESTTALHVDRDKGHYVEFANGNEKPLDAISLAYDVENATLLYILPKIEVTLSASKQEFLAGGEDSCHVTHDADVPIKLFINDKPFVGEQHENGNVTCEGEHLGSDAPSEYTVQVRDVKHWSKPLKIKAIAS